MILGIAGTAKNTGKTTTTNEILKEAARKHFRVGLTSIGYDGEDIDHVTNLPKPRVYLEAGNLLAVAENCLKGSKAVIRVLEKTEIRTPLGRIIIGEVETGGRVVVAGPNKAKDLQAVTYLLEKYQAGLILVDGALNRLAPMIVTEGLILATGASRTPDIDRLAEETEAVAAMLNLPIVSWAEEVVETEWISWRMNGSYTALTYGSLLLPGLVDTLFQNMEDEAEGLYIPGVIEEQALKRLVEALLARGFKGELVLRDPIKLLVGGNPLVLAGALNQLKEAGIALKVCTRLPLRLITVNPFYPRYRVQYRNYQPDFVDSGLLKRAIQARVAGKVINVLEDGIDLEWIMEPEIGG